MDNFSLVECYAKAYNNLNPAYLESVLDENFEYSTTWHLETLKGKDNYLTYFSEKVDLIRNKGGELKAEIIIWEKPNFRGHEPNSLHLLLYQKIVVTPPMDAYIIKLVNDNGEIDDYLAKTILFKYSNRKIKSAYLIDITLISAFERTGNFPV